jgi:hypothetical protein
MPATRSNTSPPRISSPRVAPRLDPTSTAVGVANPNAQGQATTSTSTASLMDSSSAELLPEAARAAGNKEVPGGHKEECRCGCGSRR